MRAFSWNKGSIWLRCKRGLDIKLKIARSYDLREAYVQITAITYFHEDGVSEEIWRDFLAFSVLLIVMLYIDIVKDEEKTTFTMIEMEFIMIVCLLILQHQEG